MSGKCISAEEFDRLFDEGESVVEYLDVDKAVSLSELVDTEVFLQPDLLKRVDAQARIAGSERDEFIATVLRAHLDKAA